jgi:DNA-binding MarR family transcriptional regulator/GNAT superfamily N-acetyltransferase
MEQAHVEQVRSFNRVVTQRIGALEDSYLSRGRPLGEARLIFEIGLREPVDALLLRRKLGLDSGYLSRLLRSLEGQGLAEVHKKPGDGRVRQVRLTAKGRKEFASYNALSDRMAQSILTSLNDAQQARLVAAMAEVERLYRAAAVEIAIEPPENSGARWCLKEYFAELARRFDSGFDPANGNALADDEMTPPAGWLLVARLDGEPVGCGVLKRLDDATGEIKRVWTASSVRGIGIATRLMNALEDLAREVGFAALKLDTNKTLTEAHALYRKRGYREIGRYNDNPYAHHWFEKGL